MVRTVVVIGVMGLLASACGAPELVVAQRRASNDKGVFAMAMGDPSEPKAPPYTITIAPSSVTKAEDGHGATVPAVDPRTLDVIGSPVPVRALDPVLHIGDLHFHYYTFPAKGVLRFVVADAAQLPEGAEVYLQWGEDTRSRIVITRRLKVAK